jgi:hypothetical protein
VVLINDDVVLLAGDAILIIGDLIIYMVLFFDTWCCSYDK